MTFAALSLAAALVLPADRLQMADRLFNRGRYEAARQEYAALEGESEIAADEILFRLAECDRASGKAERATERYAELARRYPESRHAAEARLCWALNSKGDERLALLRALDTDRTPPTTRAAALYHLGVETKNVDALARCVALEPRGRYAAYAKLRRGSLLVESKIADERRQGVEFMLDVAFSKDALADEALYLAAIQIYREKKYGESGSLFRRYRKRAPKGEHAAEAYTLAVWCDYLSGRYADAVNACGEVASDDFDYLRAASAYASGESQKALGLFRRYLEAYPNGRYRKDAELPLARIEFEAARSAADAAGMIEAARRAVALSKSAADELRLAWAYENAGKDEDALREYGLIAKNFPNTAEAAEALYRRGIARTRSGDWPAAELAFAEALRDGKLGRFRADALYWRGVAALNLEHEAEGAGFIRESLALGLGLDATREARLLLADIDFRNGRTNEARTAYAQLVADGAADRMSARRQLAVGNLLGGEGARTCAKALAAGASAEWRQAGWELLGRTEESAKGYVAAIDAYRRALAEPVRTEAAAAAAFRLGILEMRSGERSRAEKTLKEAVVLNRNRVRERAEIYLALAQNALSAGDGETARAYATVVISLFDDPALAAEAEKVLKAAPEPKK